MKKEHVSNYLICFLLAACCLLPRLSVAQTNQKPEPQTKVFTTSYAVKAKDLLNINTTYTNIIFQEWDKNEAKFITTVTLQKATEKDMEDLLKNVSITSHQSDNKIFYSLSFSEVTITKKNNNFDNGYEINLLVKVPRDIFLEIESRYGNVELGNIYNDFNATITYGNLKAENMFGANNHIDIRYGSLSVKEVSSLTLDSKYSTLSFGSIKSLLFTSDYGTISVQNQIDKIEGVMRYGTLTLNSLKTSCMLSNFAYSKITIGSVLSSFTNINISATYSHIKLNIPLEQSFTFDYSGGLTDFIDRNIKITNGVYFKGKPWNIKEAFFQSGSRTIEMKGMYGMDSNSKKTVTIKAYYGSVSVFKR